MQELSQVRIEAIARQLQHWQIKPNGTEGYRTAEATLGGVDCNELSSRTMESSKVAGLYFAGEVVDVTGWLGGYNFQWAWSSGWCAGQVVYAATMQAKPCIKAIRPRQLLSCRQCGRKMAVSFVRYLVLLFCLGGTSVMAAEGLLIDDRGTGNLLERIGVLAIGRAFQADVCIARVGFY